MKSIIRLAAALALVGASHVAALAAQISEIRIDWATYNPVSLVLKADGVLEKEFEKDGIKVTWVQSAGSNKALEFLNAGSLDFGSTAGAAALIGRINGNPIKSVYVYSKPEWTALVTRKDTGITTVADLKGKAIAVTRGTDPHIFLVRALAEAGLTEKDVSLVLLQHADGRLALKRGDVAAWAGLDPIMASAEIEDGDVLFHRNPANNSWGVLNVREEFAAQHPDIVRRVLRAYEQARAESQKNPAKLKAELVAATKLPEPVIERQLQRTDLNHSAIGQEQAGTIAAAGLALQKAGVVKADVDVAATVSQLIDPSYLPVGVGQ
ncbi:sulfonate transport system substrate-binding protein [Rhizobium sp. RU35A]|uniref:Putative aliphatic sulfonates-binding protein n=1 Tax=Rhizobium straminoryzae TaxID=1387186 RepID=A0A549TH83_9HYPH|nr:MULTISPECIES: aliphatic sulfonate ABC transporter substrate-binding protein [Rhizobium]TRL42290.1 aliphatic sulfonate ABC transporter substrate-binding protein [Rhizobium straminoryzae]SIQ96748.1 sulfonate transport system substrate-binding protein [Rhizobium sp. RU35A]